MFALRYRVCVSASIFLTLVCGSALQAQESSKTAEDKRLMTLEESQLSQETAQIEPRVVDIKEMTDPKPESKAQATPEEQSQTIPEPPSEPSFQQIINPPQTRLEQLPSNRLNPSGNPLMFPTKPSEVETTIRQAITLDEAISIALKNNKQLTSIQIITNTRQPGARTGSVSTGTRGLEDARLRVEEQKARLEEARAALFPTIDISASALRFRNDTAVSSTVLEAVENQTQATTFTDLRANARLVYEIYTGGRRSAEISRAEREVRLQELEVERIAEEIRFETTNGYYNLQNADAQVAIAQADVENASQTLRDARLLEQAGLGTRFDVLRGEADLARANQGLTNAIAQQRTARRQLGEVLGVGQHVELAASDEIREAGTWPMSLDETIVRAYKNRAELEQQLLQREINEQDREIALADIRPQVNFLADYEARENLDDGVPVLTDWTFQAQVSWQIFDGGRAFAGARAAERRMDQANTDFARQRDNIRFQVEQAYYNLISNQENIVSTRANVQRDEESLRLARLRFQAGVGTQTDVINAQRDLSTSRGDFLSAIIGYNQSLNALQRAVSNMPDNRLFQAP
ncbi:outer membrane efflux protein [Rippkaea orientalis PCC 8801]|uniref:Outer membrane efflux protein n=1 Tax=Rippkaea orientalis (strain PCC 8801 / RF-1) TaxID=41431 RepID=B7JVN5_RIPO1|nr:TolC family protein [Rippkaea orientalis]ACK64606.1 outer membrane efflux protein [Rippkaea orientalis PCC 8801]